MKIGIIFGGPSREREISFAGGRTVFDNLNKELFEPVPIFVDSLKNFILIDWQYLYKGSIRDFYPPPVMIDENEWQFQYYIENLTGRIDNEQAIAAIGKKINPVDFKKHFDFAFLCLHGKFGEDGVIQGMLEALDIPYSGSGVLPSAIGMNKAVQKSLMQKAFPVPPFTSIRRQWWQSANINARKTLFQSVIDRCGKPIVIRPANQGSSIGVSILNEPDFNAFADAIDAAFFIKRIEKEAWQNLDEEGKIQFITHLADIREGTGLPALWNGKVIYNPMDLMRGLESHFSSTDEPAILESLDAEKEVIVESFIDGIEFSCIVIRNADDKPVALPPTEIVKGKEVFDYRSKYLAGLSSKITPVRLPEPEIDKIRNACERLFEYFRFNVYARIDGFYSKDGTVYLNDPNTTSGMLPSSFFFHQAAEIGLNPSQFLTYIIRTSLVERHRNSDMFFLQNRIEQFDSSLHTYRNKQQEIQQIAVIMGGYSSERHISVESGRNIYEKLSTSRKFKPIPVFLKGKPGDYSLYIIPINILLKDNADDIAYKIAHHRKIAVVEKIKEKCREITSRFAAHDVIYQPVRITFEELARMVEGVFIALHGRPGEDGEIQEKLEQLGLPYNGSSPATSAITIDKYKTNQFLRKHGFPVARQILVEKTRWLDPDEKIALLEKIESTLAYPLIAKPVDDGCSSAVKRIDNRQMLEAYCKLLFRESEALPPEAIRQLQIKPKEEIPRKSVILVEEMIRKGNARKLMEVTVGLLTHWQDNGEIAYEVFEPSETLATEGVLSLEEKFLAGEGQNITPARFSGNSSENRLISEQVKRDIERAARLLNIEGYARIDAFVRIYDDLKVETLIIEVNSLPGMTPATCIFHQAALNHYKPLDFIEKIIEYGMKKNLYKSQTEKVGR